MGRTLVLAGGRVLVHVTVFLRRGAGAPDVREKIVAEVFDRIEYRDRRSGAERAFAVFEELGQVFDDRQIAFLGGSRDKGRQGIHQDLGAFLARGALAADVHGLDPSHVVGRHGGNIHILVVQDDSVPTHEGSQCPFSVKGDGQAERRILQFATCAVVNDVSPPAGKDHLCHVRLQKNRSAVARKSS